MAISSYKQAIKCDPAHSDAYNNLAWVYIQLNTHLDEAGDYIEKALEINPCRKVYYLDTQGELYLTQGKYRQAVVTFQKAIEEASEEKLETRASLYYHLGIAYQTLGELENANLNFGKALELNPELKIKNRLFQKESISQGSQI
jgi:tetratricopeptide (TPR) repeat protein